MANESDYESYWVRTLIDLNRCILLKKKIAVAKNVRVNHGGVAQNVRVDRSLVAQNIIIDYLLLIIFIINVCMSNFLIT